MKLPNNFPKELDGKKLLFVTVPKCFSGIYDVEKRKTILIEYYAIAKNDENSEIRLLSMDNSFNIIADSSFSTVDEAIYELEPDNIYQKDWRELD
jgi:hypothetical protein